jgi:hypothetical protein
MRRPAAMLICGIGIAMGFPVGRLLCTERDVVPAPKRLSISSLSRGRADSFPLLPDGVAEAKTMVASLRQARTAQEVLGLVPKIDLRQHPEWRCVPTFPILLALCRMGELDDPVAALTVFARNPHSKEAGYVDQGNVSLSLISWAERQPREAWLFYTEELGHLPRLRQGELFAGWMSRHHWDIVKEDVLAGEKVHLPNRKAWEWNYRLKDGSTDPANILSNVEEYPEKARFDAFSDCLWLLAPRDANAARSLAQRWPDEAKRGEALSAVASASARTNPGVAAEILENLSSDHYWLPTFYGGERYNAAEVFVQEAMQPSPRDTLKYLATVHSKTSSMNLYTAASELPDDLAPWWPIFESSTAHDPYRASLLSGLLGQIQSLDAPRAARTLSSLKNPELLAAAANVVASRWAEQDPRSALQWVQSLPVEARAEALAGAAMHSGPETAATALECYAANGLLPREETVANLVLAAPEVTSSWLVEQPLPPRHMAIVSKAWAARNPNDAVGWAANLPDAAGRVAAVSAAVNTWMEANPDAAAAWVSRSSLTSDELRAVRDATGL